MKKSYAQLILFTGFAVFTALIIHFRKPDQTYRVEMRTGLLASTSEWQNTESAIAELVEKVNANPADNRSALALGMAYIQESRISGNHSYYDAAAIQLFDKILSDDPENVECLIGKATVLLSQHHFTDAIPVALKAEQLNPYSSSVYGLLTDAYVETGDYEKAVQSADKMSSTRPDMRSYSRISYLREIFGDYPGSIDAMKMAVEAGYPGLEQTEWSRYQLGCLYEKTGEPDAANLYFEQCIYYRPSFSWAYSGKGRVEMAKGNYKEAIRLTNQALTVLKDFSFQQQLTELYRITNQQQLAAESARKTIELLAGLNGNQSKETHGHYADKELAYAYLDAYDYSKALTHALTEYNRRPDNIDVNHALGWVYYKLGRYIEAEKYIDAALQTNSSDAILNYQAGLIKIKAGNNNEGQRLLDKALVTSKYISPLLKNEVSLIAFR